MMDPLWLLLLLPVAMVSGWFAARLDQRSRLQQQRQSFPQAYIEGLNFLLNEQPDKAIEVFIKALEVDPETVETHLAIGNLFRRRGEIERATRIHQNLIARPHLEKIQRYQALFELAQDYHKAGLLDRAENLFLEVVDAPLHGEAALNNLVDIYQQEKDWNKAIQTCKKLGRLTGERTDYVVAQYYCEQADQAEAEQNYELSEKLAHRALGVDKTCVRATMLLGKAALRSDDHLGAIKIWRKIESQDPHLLGEVVSLIAASFTAVGDGDGLQEFLQSALDRHDDMTLMLALGEVIERKDGNKAAQKFVLDWLRSHPSAAGLERLIELRLAETGAHGQRDLEILKGIISGLIEQHVGYACSHCGFRAKSLHWQCPSCRRWSTIKPFSAKTEGQHAEK
ncbi:MAG: lipopolysaccharide assembly protein LapB [Gammaproteobacteria bacterium]|nr:lipopolysaccharide assembly protein LapB [Gammaproteobacteria bacterium]